MLWVRMVFGSMLLVIGFAGLFSPLPVGLPLIIMGLGLLSAKSKIAARLHKKSKAVYTWIWAYLKKRIGLL